MENYNPVKLGIWNNEFEQRAVVITNQLREHLILKTVAIDDLKYKVCDYKSGTTMPVIDDSFTTFKRNDKWGNKLDSHAWFYKKINFILM